MDAAIKIIMKEFEAFEGCELHSLSYTSDEEYTDWSWWLARSDDGEWKLMTYGY